MTRNALTDQNKIFCTNLICYQNAKVHQPRLKKYFVKFYDVIFPLKRSSDRQTNRQTDKRNKKTIAPD